MMVPVKALVTAVFLWIYTSTFGFSGWKNPNSNILLFNYFRSASSALLEE